MNLQVIDFGIIAVYVLFMLGIAWYFSKKQYGSIQDYFAAGKNTPWWVLGISMVATTFAADTPLAVTGIVASDGIAGNWVWWSFMASGLVTVFFYARLWQRSGVLTDVEFAILRYSGKPAKILRWFRALYLALPINCIILGWVTVGMSKILTVLTGAPQWMVIVGLYVGTGAYIAVSGIWGVLVTDVFQFTLAMIGSIIFAVLAVEEVGGLAELSTQLQGLQTKSGEVLNLIPDSGSAIFTTFLVWISTMWWASWYPGSEPGGGGYVAQRMISAKTERDAVGATLFFNVAHFALRPWPWILVGLSSLVLLPDLQDKELGYPLLMLEVLPPGLTGLLLVVFISAFISTVSTHLNWGASYLVNDVYLPWQKGRLSLKDEHQVQKHLVHVGRISTLIIMIVAIVISYFFDSVKGGWEALLSLGAGIGPVYMLRWFWPRINAWSEISAMIGAATGTVLIGLTGLDDFGLRLLAITAFSSLVWLVTTFFTQPEPDHVLRDFARKARPPLGFSAFGQKSLKGWLPRQLLNVALGLLAINLTLFGMGTLFFGSLSQASFMLGSALISAIILVSRIEK